MVKVFRAQTVSPITKLTKLGKKMSKTAKKTSFCALLGAPIVMGGPTGVTLVINTTLFSLNHISTVIQA